MDFAKLLSEQDRMTRGDARIDVNNKLSLETFTESVKDQEEDLVGVLSELSEEDLADLSDAVSEAVEGLVEAGERMRALSEIGLILRESDDPEQQKLFPIIQKTRGGLANLGQLLKTLKVAANKATQASWRQ